MASDNERVLGHRLCVCVICVCTVEADRDGPVTPAAAAGGGQLIMGRGGTFCKMLGWYLMFHARFIHATLIGVMLNFWKVGVAPTTPFYTKNPPLIMGCMCVCVCTGGADRD